MQERTLQEGDEVVVRCDVCQGRCNQWLGQHGRVTYAGPDNCSVYVDRYDEVAAGRYGHPEWTRFMPRRYTINCPCVGIEPRMVRPTVAEQDCPHYYRLLGRVYEYGEELG